MKLKFLINNLFLSALTAVALASCIDDVPGSDCVDDNGTGTGASTLEAGQEYSVLFELGMDSGSSISRSESFADGGFNDGDENEYAVDFGGNFAIFFKDEKLLMVKEISKFDKSMHPDDNITVVYETKLKVNPEDFAKPVQCLIIVNAGPQTEYYKNLEEGTTMNDVLMHKWGTGGANGPIGRDENRFIMANSVWQGHSTVEVTEDNLMYDTERYTMEEITKKIIHVQVERMLGKVSFALPQTPGSYAELGGTYDGDGVFTFYDSDILYCNEFDETGKPKYTTRSWKAKVTGWGMNAFEKDGYIVKQLNGSTNYFTGWNDPTNYRSYWAVDDHYDQVTDYPWQYRRAVDQQEKAGNRFTYYSKKGDNNNYLLNFSFNQLNNPILQHVEYIAENTYDAAKVGDIDSRTDLLAGTHLIICAELLTDIPNVGTFNVNNDLYRDYQGVFYETAKNCFWVLARRFIMDLQSQTTMKYYLYDWTENEYLETFRTYEALTTGGEYTLYYDGEPLTYERVMDFPDDEVIFIPAEIDAGDGRVIPWLEGLTISNGTKNVPIYYEIKQNSKPGDDDYDNLASQKENQDNYIRPATENDIKSLFLEWLGPVDHFKQSKMYYAAPAKLLTLNGDTSIHGVVRNNWYTYLLTSINKIGTSVDNLDQPIVPDVLATKNRVNVTTEIIDWHRFTFTAPLL